MLDVGHRFLQQLAYVLVVKLIDDPSTIALSGHQAEVAKDAQLVGNGRGLHPDRFRKLADRAGTLMQLAEDPQTAWGRESVQGLGDLTCDIVVEEFAWISDSAVAHGRGY